MPSEEKLLVTMSMEQYQHLHEGHTARKAAMADLAKEIREMIACSWIEYNPMERNLERAGKLLADIYNTCTEIIQRGQTDGS